MAKWIHEKHTVAFHECDPIGTVYNRNYFVWFEQARFKICELSNMASYIKDVQLEKGESIIFPVLEAQCKFLLPIPNGTKIIISTKLEKPKFAKLKFKHIIVDELTNQEYAKGETIVGFVSSTKGLLLNIPDEAKELLDNYLCG